MSGKEGFFPPFPLFGWGHLFLVLCGACASGSGAQRAASPSGGEAGLGGAGEAGGSSVGGPGSGPGEQTPGGEGGVSVQVDEAKDRAPGAVASVTFGVKVAGPGSVEVAGFVRNRDGGPVTGACVEIIAGNGRKRPRPVFSAADGAFRFLGIPAGIASVTITVDDPARARAGRIADHHDQDPRFELYLRPLLLLPPGDRLEALRIKRMAEAPEGAAPGPRWVEVAPSVLPRDGYSPACQRARAERRRPPQG